MQADLAADVERDMNRKLFALGASMITGLVVGLILAQPADAAPRSRHRQLRAAEPQQRIACTVIGCMAVPSGCAPVAGKTPGGIPTGYDVIVCPPGRFPW